jgi:integrase
MMASSPFPAGKGGPEKQVSSSAFRYLVPEDFDFDEDVWNFTFRSTVARRSSGKVSFAAFPASIKREVKEFLAHGTLVLGLSNSWMHSAVAALKKALLPLCEEHGSQFSLLNLAQQDAMFVEETISQSGVIHARRQIALVADFAEFLRERYDGRPAGFRPHPQAAPPHHYTKRSYSEGLEQVIPDEVSDALMEAITRHQIYLDELAKRTESKQSLAAHLYLAALVVLIFSGRRISEVLFLKPLCLREPTAHEMKKIGHEGVWLKYRNTKVGLGLKEVFIPEPGADLVRQAVTRAQRLTEPLREESGLDLLFLRYSARGEPCMVDSGLFTPWLSGQTTKEGHVERPGFIHRYNIRYQGQYYYINLHQARHTLAYKAYLGGASYVDVGDHLHHRRTRAGLSPMTGVYLHGQEKAVQFIREMHARREVIGKAAPLIDNRMVVSNNLAPSDMSIWREQGMVLHPTHYGH